MKVRVELSLIEGWVDKPGNRLGETLARVYDLPAMPQKGDYLDTGRGSEPVDVVFWTIDGRPPLLRLRRRYTGSTSMDEEIAGFEALGWAK